MSENQVTRIGVDIGGVIIDRKKVGDGEDTQFHHFASDDRFLETQAVPYAFEALARLVKRFGRQNIYLISKAGEATARKTIEWLAHYGFCPQTGIDPTNIHFCDTRPQKGPICKELGITHFIDDRIESLEYVYQAGIWCVFHFRPELDRDLPKFFHNTVFHKRICVTDWQRVLQILATQHWVFI